MPICPSHREKAEHGPELPTRLRARVQIKYKQARVNTQAHNMPFAATPAANHLDRNQPDKTGSHIGKKHRPAYPLLFSKHSNSPSLFSRHDFRKPAPSGSVKNIYARTPLLPPNTKGPATIKQRICGELLSYSSKDRQNCNHYKNDFLNAS